MADNAMFRNALYGFNKEDVLKYIETIKSEAQVSDTFKKIDELEQQISSKNQTIQELQLENKQYQDKILELSKGQNTSNTINKDAIEMEAIKAENDELKSALDDLKCKCKRLKNIEETFESVVLDAYVYSGNILDDAVQRAEQIAKGSKNTIEQVAGDMGDFSSYVNNISKEFSKIVSGLTNDIKGITENLVSVAKDFRQNNDEEDTENSSIENYIDSSIEQIISSNLSYSDTDIADNISDFDDYIKVFETLISGDIEGEEPKDETSDFLQNQTKVTSELISQYTSDDALDNKEQVQDTNNAETQANFISAQPIGSAIDEEQAPPLNPVVRLDENFKMQDNNLNSAEKLEPDYFEGEELQEDFIPLHGGMDYSSFLQTGGEVKYNIEQNSTDLQNENIQPAEEKSDNINEDVQDINIQKVESKGVEIQLDEPVMLDLNGNFNDNQEKSRFSKIKLKNKKDK